ncbi:MAG: uL15 family ribosomal protein [Candidatus Aenigmarchaeota archaeon]|nr:uL15 family ribosomal protein [Candidatus Aenigmarchaeota archaeon]
MVMVVRFRKKVRRQRGTRWHGYGSKKKKRGGGSRGGRGFSGFHKHKYSYVVAKDPEHYGEKGFVVPHKKKANVINVGDLEKLAAAGEIDLGGLGYQKLLSKGSVSKPLKVVVEEYTKKAGDKVRAAGGSLEGEETGKAESKAEGKEKGK